MFVCVRVCDSIRLRRTSIRSRDFDDTSVPLGNIVKDEIDQLHFDNESYNMPMTIQLVII